MTLRIGPVDRREIPGIVALAHEAANWLTAKGEALWGPNELKDELFFAAADKGTLIAAHVGETLAACMFLQASDPDFWPDDPPREALYIHRLAVARKYAGQGVSQAMLQWAGGQARSGAFKYLRLDCVPRPKLLALYAAAGFVRVDKEPVCLTGHWVIRHQMRI